jgi:hypothetical protein
MLTSLQDFDNSSAFERSALAAVFPLIPVSQAVARASVDQRAGRRGATIGVMAIDDLGDAARHGLIDQLRPLCFGAAWKVLDLFFELALHSDSLSPKQPGKWTIAEKQTLVRQRRGQCNPLSHDADIWQRLCGVYDRTVEARHSLVHRRFSMSANGDMTDIKDGQGNLMPALTVAEQEAFCRTALRVAAAALRSAFSNRDRLDLAWWLDQLATHHGFAALGGTPGGPPPIVRVDAALTPSGWIVDIDGAAARVSTVFAGRPFYDIEIHFPGSGLAPLTGRLEEAPRGSCVAIDPSVPPAWIDP